MLTKNTSWLRALVQKHLAADQVRQGTYWRNDRGCFVGCLNHNDNTEYAESTFGLPATIQRIAESIFESLSTNEAVAFFASFPDAIQCDGKDLSCVGWRFLAAELRALPPVDPNAHPGVQALIDSVIAGIEILANGQEWTSARAARDAARTAHDGIRLGSRSNWKLSGSTAIAERAIFTAVHAATAAFLADWHNSDCLDIEADKLIADAVFYACATAVYIEGDSCSYPVNSRRQRDCLLRLICQAPVVGAES